MKFLVLLFASSLLFSACNPLAEKLNPREREMLEMFNIAELPASPGNAQADNPAAALLGQKIFFDPRFSGALGGENDGKSGGSLGMSGESGKISCVACHDLKNGGSDQRSRPARTSIGAGRTGRNAPTVVNSAYSKVWQSWDGRKDSLWSQTLGPLESATVHNSTRLAIAHTVFDNYRGEYEALFGPLPDLSDTMRFPPAGKPGAPAWDMMADQDKVQINRVFANVGKVIESYERLLRCENSPFDKWAAGDENAMNPLAVRGYRLFIGEAGCLECHREGTFSDYEFHNIGVPEIVAEAMVSDTGRLKGIETVKNDPFNRAGIYSDQVDDAHLATLEAGPETKGQFKTPSLRCVELTAPYMHNGAYEDLWAVVTHYRGGGATGNFEGAKDLAIQPLALDDDDLNALVEFLRALTGEPLPEELVTPPQG